MLIKSIILTLAVASIAYADVISRTAPNPGGCKDGYHLKKGCGKDGTDICCPVKIGRSGVDDKDKCRDKCKGSDKKCIAPEPPRCPASYYACSATYGGNCCPGASVCGTVGGNYICILR